jgi:hypothetical protein
VLVESVAIVASILLAFGVDAWWDARLEARRRAELMDDLRVELQRNRADLTNALERQRLRLHRLEILLGEITPQAVGLAPDSLRALQQSTLLGNPTYDPGLGILELLIQSGDLILVESRDLRARLAGLPALSADYLNNQLWLVNLTAQPEVLFGTGSMVVDYSRFSDGDATLTAASAVVREQAAKYIQVVINLTSLLIPQGETLLTEYDAILALMEDDRR